MLYRSKKKTIFFFPSSKRRFVAKPPPVEFCSGRALTNGVKKYACQRISILLNLSKREIFMIVKEGAIHGRRNAKKYKLLRERVTITLGPFNSDLNPGPTLHHNLELDMG